MHGRMRGRFGVQPVGLRRGRGDCSAGADTLAHALAYAQPDSLADSNPDSNPDSNANTDSNPDADGDKLQYGRI